MKNHGRWSRVGGWSLLGVLLVISLGAPQLATDRLWLARSEEGSLAYWVSSREPGYQPILQAPVPFNPLTIDTDHVLEPPSARHWLGTDSLGRDLLSRVLHGGRRSLGAALAASVLALFTGVALGSLAGLSRRTADLALCRGADIVNAFPPLVGAMALLGLSLPLDWIPVTARVGGVIGLFSWPALFRFVRAETERQARGDLVAAARAAGAGQLRTMTLHLVPQLVGPLAVPVLFLAAGTILAEAGLGFLGLGLVPPWPSWGNLLFDGMSQVRSAWWLTAFPGLFLFLTVFSLYLVGEGLRPSHRGKSF